MGMLVEKIIFYSLQKNHTEKKKKKQKPNTKDVGSHRNSSRTRSNKNVCSC